MPSGCDAQISLEEHIDHMKEEQNDIHHINGEGIAMLFSSSVQLPKESDGRKLMPTTKVG